MSKFKLNPLSIALLGAIATPTFAETTTENQNHQLSTIVVSAAGYEQKITDAPASISVITEKELRSKSYTNLLDAVRDLEGVDIGSSQDKSGQSTISMRGLGSDYTLVLIDGKRQNNNGDIYPNDFSGFQSAHIPPLDMIERIEVIRGPMSTLYGADALGGVINIITKKVAKEWGGSVTMSQLFQEESEWGDEHTTDFYIAGPLIPNKLGLSIRGSQYKKDESLPSYDSTTAPDGSNYQPSLGFGGAGKTSDNTNWSGGVRLAFTPNETHEVIVDYDVSKQKYDNRNAQFGTTDSAETIRKNARVGYAETQRTEREQFYISHVGNWNFGRSEISLQHINTENHGRSLPLTAEQRKELKALTGTNAEKEQWITDNLLPRPKRELASSGYTLDAKIDLPFEKHNVVVGTQLINTEMEDGVFGMAESGYHNGTTQKHKQWSLFAEDTWKILEPLSVTAGLRYDNHEFFGDHFSPRIYGVYTATPNWTVKGGISTGFKTPKTSDLYPGITGFGSQGTSPWAGNPDIKPETSTNSEIAVYYQADAGHSFNATLFMTKFKDKIETTGNCKNSPEGSIACSNIDSWWTESTGGNYNVNYKGNTSNAELKGIELAGKYYLPYDLTLKGNYTYTTTKITSGEKKGQPFTSSVPVKHMFNTTLDWQANDRFNMYLTANANSKRYAGLDNDGDEIHYKDYVIFHLGGSYKVNNDITINARINNLFNKDFTTYHLTDWKKDNDGNWDPKFNEDYNVIHKARNLWLSVNARF